MFERFNTREELYNYKLGSALKMEHTVLDMLDANAKEAKDPKLSQLFRHHQDETRQQIVNIEQAFAHMREALPGQFAGVDAFLNAPA